jgi:hypothetical protein
MSRSRATLGWVERERLNVCMLNVANARVNLRAAQGVPGGRGVYDLRAELIGALEAYAQAITELGAPLPRKLRAELDLLRRIGHRG